MVPYIRPKLTEEESSKVSYLAKLLVYATVSKAHKLRMVTAIMTENAKLLKEVNDHRETLGFEPLPIFDPTKDLHL